MERMPISAEQVENKEFVVTLRGYDKVEVDEFLQELALDYRTALDLAATAVDTEIESESDAVIREAEQVLAMARREADAVVARAREQADAVVDRAVAEARDRLRHLMACERVTRTRLTTLQSVIEQALALPTLDGVVDIAAAERELAAKQTDPEAIDLRGAVNTEK